MSQATSVSDEAALRLVQRMIQQGFFHDSLKRVPLLLAEDDDMAVFERLQATDATTGFGSDPNCKIVPTIQYESFHTRERVLDLLRKEMDDLGGRLDVGEAARLLQVKAEYLGPDFSILSMLPDSIQLLGTQLVSTTFWDYLKLQVLQDLEAEGRVALPDFSAQHAVPMESLLEKCLLDLPGVAFLGYSKAVLVTDSYLVNMKTDVIQRFRAVEKRTPISTICQEQGWDFDLVLEWLMSSIADINGEVHVDQSSTSSALFIPARYKDKQEKDVFDFVARHGYLTKQGGVPIAQAIEIVRQRFTGVKIIGDVLFVDFLLQRVREAISELSTSDTVNLGDCLDPDLVRPNLIQEILRDAGFTKSNGVSVVVNGQALLVSHKLIRSIFSKLLPPIVNEFAKKTAERLFQTALSPQAGNDDSGMAASLNRKTKGKKGKGKKSTKSSDGDTITSSKIPLLSIVGALLDSYPAFGDESTGQKLLDRARSLSWDSEEGDDILVVAFCREAVNTQEFQTMCDKAVNAELEQLHAAVASKATLTRKDAAAKLRSVESAFEDIFISSCYWIQLFSKFIDFAVTSGHLSNSSLAELRSEFLLGICADFTSRMTQYCMFKTEDDAQFTFEIANASSSKDSSYAVLPDFCRDVDPVMLRFPHTYLSCPLPREPLVVLRESLPGNSGVSLARQWIHCGGESYRGGLRVGDDGTSHIRAGSVEGFVAHVAENCLSVCGLPFKKIDKKAEKKFLFERKKAMAHRLEMAYDPLTILELTISILFQQIRQLIATGSLLREVLLKVLVNDRKLPEHVGLALVALNDAITNEARVDDGLLSAVKEFGLSRDVSKHEISSNRWQQ